jgi:hypothetical protein
MREKKDLTEDSIKQKIIVISLSLRKFSIKPGKIEERNRKRKF